MICDTPEKINAFRLLALKGALTLETKGLKRRGQSALSIVKREFNLKGNAQTVLAQYEQLLRDQGILR